MIFTQFLLRVDRRRYWAGVLLGYAMLLSFAMACSGDSVADAPRLDQPGGTGGELANEFLTLLQRKDREGLQSFLSDAFIIQRADGSSSTKADYLNILPDIGPYEIGDVDARQDGNSLVVHWVLTVQQVIDGQTYKTTPAPRLSTFTWADERWRLIAHANFNAPESPPSGQ